MSGKNHDNNQMNLWIYLIKLSKTSVWKKTVLGLVAIVVFVTTYLLVLPAITLERDVALEDAGISLFDSGVSGNDVIVNGEDMEESLPGVEFCTEVDDCKIEVFADPDAFPAGTSMTATMLEEQMQLDRIAETAQAELKASVEHWNKEVKQVKAINITFTDESGNEIEPAVPIRVKMTSELIRSINEKEETPIIFHMEDDGTGEILENVETGFGLDSDQASFDAEQFSVYAILETQEMRTRVITAEGEQYEVSVTYDAEAHIPERAVLNVREVTASNEPDHYEEYIAASSEAACGDPGRGVLFAKIFDISILDENGLEVEPDSAVEVRIAYALPSENEQTTDPYIVHFAQGGPEVIVPISGETTDGRMDVTFVTDSFSMYTIIKNSGEFELGEEYGIISAVELQNWTGVGEMAVNALGKDFDYYGGQWRTYCWGNGNSTTVSWDDAYILRILTKTGGTSPIGTFRFERVPNGNMVYMIATNGAKNGNYFFLGDRNTLVNTNSGAVKFPPNGMGRFGNARNNAQGEGGDGYWNMSTDADRANCEIEIIDNGDGTVTLHHGEWYLTRHVEADGHICYTSEPRIVTNGVTDIRQRFVLAKLGSETPAAKSAQKKNVNDLINNEKVIIYYLAKENEQDVQYSFYALAADGSRLPVEDIGDEVIYWESQGKDLEWTFSQISFVNEEGVPTVAYELVNKDGKRLLPTANGIFTDLEYGSILPGIQGNKPTYGSTIENWDAEVGSYFGLKYDASLEAFVPVEAGDEDEIYFYFAQAKDKEYDELNFDTVETVDSKAQNITIKMYDFTEAQMIAAFTGAGGGYGTMINTYLTDGYPTYKGGGTTTTVQKLFEDNYVSDANHLFLQSVYDATGYFQFRSQDNYAYLNQNGTDSDFVVYTANAVPGDFWHDVAYGHGNFMPYNPLEKTVGSGELADGVRISADNYNTYDEEGNPIPTDNPRFGDQLYVLNNPDYYFGMTMETAFIQPRSGLVNDDEVMTFEFNGDDDLWVFIDDILVLDIGGTHAARTGVINFNTGTIVQQVGGTTTIRQRFEEARAEAQTVVDNPTASAAQRAAAQAVIDKVDATSFRDNTLVDYTSHTLKVFYMERGAGASNLNLRFNLISVEPSQFTVEKELVGDYQTAYGGEQFAYRAYAKQNSDPDYRLITPAMMNENILAGNKTVSEAIKTKWDGTTENLLIDEHGVFWLRPGESVSFKVANDQVKYYVQEIGINDEIFDVGMNMSEGSDYLSELDAQEAVDGTQNQFFHQSRLAGEAAVPASIDTGEMVAQTGRDDVTDRPKVVYTNHVKKTTDLRIKKELAPDLPEITMQTLPKKTFTFYIQMVGADGVVTPYKQGDYWIHDEDNHYYRYVNKKLVLQDDPTAPGYPLRANISGLNGSIEGIPAGYTVEIRKLLPGTDFIVTEMSSDNYQWNGYTVTNAEETDVTTFANAVMVNEPAESLKTRENGAAGKLLQTVTLGGEIPAAEVKVVNAPKTAEYTIVKADGDTINAQSPTKLANATFTLSYKTGVNQNGTLIYTAVQEGGNPMLFTTGNGEDATILGEITLEGLAVGQYYKLTEVKAPAGYIMLEGDTYFYLDEDGSFVFTDNQGNLLRNGEHPASGAIQDEDAITIPNTAGAVLPSTGGEGTRRLYGYGLFLTLTAAIVLLGKCRTRAK